MPVLASNGAQAIYCDEAGPPWVCRASSPSSSPEHLVQVAFQEGDRVQGKLLQVGQVEKLRGELGNQLLLWRPEAGTWM
jgi:hypothetical protein